MSAIDLKLIRAMLAFVWIVTGILSLGIFPQSESLELLEQVGLQGTTALVALYGSALLDILLGVLTLTHPAKLLWRVQAILVVAYSGIIAIYLPMYWLHPFGPILKNLPILLLLLLLHKHEENGS
ncbi:DoxX-like family protein [Acidithiobacillus sp.]|uniref:DoxX-like family protein n=1 Tax=Acidithiobacillus sp. TaxID=1872118 RepID=UPI0025BFE005|nr:DoxX-like family protein [Acidithiobacillus sp.]MCK9189900.1 DoxX-like family protein [Acidithiobacillus sp.]